MQSTVSSSHKASLIATGTCGAAADYNVYLANPPGYTSFTVFPQPSNPLWADGTVLYYGNLRGEWMTGENSGKVLAHEVNPNPDPNPAKADSMKRRVRRFLKSTSSRSCALCCVNYLCDGPHCLTRGDRVTPEQW